MKYTVIGSRRVGGVEPGGTVTLEQLEQYGPIQLDALLGTHLEPADAEAKKKAGEAAADEPAAPVDGKTAKGRA